MTNLSQRMAQQALGSHETVGSAGADRPLGRGRSSLEDHTGWGAPRLLSPPPDAQGPLTSPCQHFSLFCLSQRFHFFLGKESSARMACLGMTLHGEVRRVSSVSRVFLTH